MSSTLNLALTNAISYLTRPLIVSYSPATILKLQLILEANLTNHFAPTWFPTEPLRGSGTRCLTLSPKCLPPHVIYSACLSSGVQWFDWIALLGGREFDFFIDPGCVSARFGKKGNPASPLIIVWSDERPAFNIAFNNNRVKPQQNISLAQQLMEEDKHQDDELFAMLSDEINAPSWMTPILDQFPMCTRSSSPLSAISAHSRSSSRSSNSSSCFSSDSADSCGSATTISTLASSEYQQQSKQSRREKARHARVFVDPTKTEVTPYDGGKTTVLTGGVMLGGPPAVKKVARPTYIASNNWRSGRF